MRRAEIEALLGRRRGKRRGPLDRRTLQAEELEHGVAHARDGGEDRAGQQEQRHKGERQRPAEAGGLGGRRAAATGRLRLGSRSRAAATATAAARSGVGG